MTEDADTANILTLSGTSNTSYKIPASCVKDDTATCEVVISSKNYENVTAAWTFNIVDKTPVTITGLAAATGLTNTGKVQNGYAGTAVTSDTSGEKAIKGTASRTEPNKNDAVTLADGKLVIHPAGERENPFATLPGQPISTPIIVVEWSGPGKSLRVVPAKLIPDEEELLARRIVNCNDEFPAAGITKPR